MFYRAHALVSALLGELLGDSGDVIRGLRDGLGAGDQILLAADAGLAADELGQLGHEEGHALGGGDDVIVLARPLLHLLMQVVRSQLQTKIGITSL